MIVSNAGLQPSGWKFNVQLSFSEMQAVMLSWPGAPIEAFRRLLYEKIAELTRDDDTTVSATEPDSGDSWMQK